MTRLPLLQISLLALVSAAVRVAAACGATYAQCGGKGFAGDACCVSGSTCVSQNDYYSQCLPGSKPVSASTSKSTAAFTSASSRFATMTTSSKTTAPTSNVVASSSVTTRYTGPRQGDGTFYGNDDSGGNCKLPARSDLAFVAWPGPVYENAHYCGACLKITGDKGSAFAQITNKCPECKAGDLDMSTSIYDKVTTASGRGPISWDFVDCVSAGLNSGALSYVWKSGSTQSWAQVQVRGASLPIESVQVDGQTLVRQDYNYFAPSTGGGFGAGPFTIKTIFQDGTSKTESVPLNGKVEDA